MQIPFAPQPLYPPPLPPTVPIPCFAIPIAEAHPTACLLVMLGTVTTLIRKNSMSHFP